MVNYNNSIIYKLCCKNINIKEIYIGSTSNELRKRKNQHKSDCNNVNRKHYNLNVYKFIRENGGFSNWSMIEVERYSAIDKLDLHKRERYYIELLNATLNNNIPNRSQKEYYKNNKDKLLEKQKEYDLNNKDKKKEQIKEHYEKNKQKILEKASEKIECKLCNKIMNISSLNRHNKTFH